MASAAPTVVSPRLAWFSTGNAMSRAPIWSGMRKFMKPVMKGIPTKKIMIVPWVEKSSAKCSGARNPPS